MTTTEPKLNDVIAMVVAGHKAAVESLDGEDRAAFARLWVELIDCVLGTGDRDDVPEIVDTMKEIIGAKTSTAKAFDTDECSVETNKWLEYISGKIKDARKAAGLTQAQLAEKSGLPQSHISRLENAEHSPSRKTLEKIAVALGIDVKTFDPCSD